VSLVALPARYTAITACIALRLDGELWLLIEPNAEIISVMPLEWAMGTAYKDLKTIGTVLPGVSFFEQIGGHETDFQ